WLCRTSIDRAIVVGSRSAVDLWRTACGSWSGLGIRCRTNWAASALAVVGPKAPRLFAALGITAALESGSVERVRLNGVSVTVLSEGHESFLLLAPIEAVEAVWQLVLTGGRELGVIPIGCDALERRDISLRHAPAA